MSDRRKSAFLTADIANSLTKGKKLSTKPSSPKLMTSTDNTPARNSKMSKKGRNKKAPDSPEDTSDGKGDAGKDAPQDP